MPRSQKTTGSPTSICAEAAIAPRSAPILMMLEGRRSAIAP
jgi:hypothetical protein